MIATTVCAQKPSGYFAARSVNSEHSHNQIRVPSAISKQRTAVPSTSIVRATEAAEEMLPGRVLWAMRGIICPVRAWMAMLRCDYSVRAPSDYCTRGSIKHRGQESRMKWWMVLGFLLSVGVAHALTPVERLRAARSLRCHFIGATSTTWKNGDRLVNPSDFNPNDKANEVTYDDINAGKGTARIIGNLGAGSVTVHFDMFGALWIEDTPPSGFVFVSTVVPIYARGTSQFIILESRQSWIGGSALAQQSSGTCEVLE
jgi:hypothetical protein